MVGPSSSLGDGVEVIGVDNPMILQLQSMLVAYFGRGFYDVEKPLLYDVITPAPVLDMLLRWQYSDGGGRQQDAAEQLANLLTMTGMDVALGVRCADLDVAGQLICKAPARTEISGAAVPVDMHEVVLDARSLPGQHVRRVWCCLLGYCSRRLECGVFVFEVNA
jgi:hypothetical protein